MDHKWGRNIYDLGLGSLGATIAARWLPAPRFVVTNVRGPFNTALWAVLPVGDNQAYDFQWIPTGALPGMNFPWFWAVEPDEPVP